MKTLKYISIVALTLRYINGMFLFLAQYILWRFSSSKQMLLILKPSVCNLDLSITNDIVSYVVYNEQGDFNLEIVTFSFLDGYDHQTRNDTEHHHTEKVAIENAHNNQ